MAEASFSLDVPQSIQVTGGQSSQTIVKVSKSPGRPKTVTLSVIDIPVGIAVDFLPDRGRPNFQSTLTVTATPALPDGEYAFFVRATDGEIIRSMPITIVKAGIAQPQPPAAAPVLTSLSPSSATAGDAGFTMQVNGTGFVSGATAYWNGSSRSTSFISSTRIDATISSGDVASAGTASVTATNPASAASNALTFTINAGGFSADVWVATTGSSGNSGLDINHPKQTFAQGLAILGEGQKMAVRGGTYAELISPIGGNSEANRKTIIAYPGETPILKPSSGSNYVITFEPSSAQYLTIDGLTIDAVNITSGGGIKTTQGNGGAAFCTIQNCEIKNYGVNSGNNAQGILAGGATGSSTVYIVIRNCNIHDGGHSGSNQAGHGVYHTPGACLLENCFIHDTGGLGLQIYPNDEGSTIRRNKVFNVGIQAGTGGVLLSGHNTLCYDNLIWSNTNGAIAVGTSNGTTANIRIWHNTIYNTSGWYGVAFESWVTSSFVENNIFYQNSVGNINLNGASVTVNANTTANPSFVSASGAISDNLHLQSGSIARPQNGFSGVDLNATVTVDYDGVARPDSPCAGAYEFV